MYRGHRGGFFAISKVPGQWQAPTECDASHCASPIRDHFEDVGLFSIRVRAAKSAYSADIETKRKVFTAPRMFTSGEKTTMRDWKSVVRE